MKIVAGWKEVVALPELGLRRLTAKLDSGARSAALHATDILVYETDSGRRVAFTVHPHRSLRGRGIRCTAPLVEQREVTNSGGEVQERYVVRTEILLGNESWSVEITLTDRTRMRYPMLLGRTTLGDRYLIDPGQTYLLGKGRDRR